MTEHEQVCVKHPRGYEVEVDVGIADLIKELWRRGYYAFSSCQDNFVDIGNGRRHYVWIEFVDTKTAERFITTYIDDTVEKYNAVQEEWDIKSHVDNTHLIYDEAEDTLEDLLPLDLRFTESVRFPIAYLKDVKKTFGIRT